MPFIASFCSCHMKVLCYPDIPCNFKTLSFEPGHNIQDMNDVLTGEVKELRS